MPLHDRIAKALNWPVTDVQTLSFQSLRELVKSTHPKLAHEITQEIRSGRYIVGEPLRRNRTDQEGQT